MKFFVRSESHAKCGQRIFVISAKKLVNTGCNTHLSFYHTLDNNNTSINIYPCNYIFIESMVFTLDVFHTEFSYLPFRTIGLMGANAIAMCSWLPLIEFTDIILGEAIDLRE